MPYRLIIHLLLGFSGASFMLSCSPQNDKTQTARRGTSVTGATGTAQSGSEGTAPGDINATSKELGAGTGEESSSLSEEDTGPKPVVRPKVSAFEIDDKKFSLVQLTVGLQQFMTSETPVISYKIPELADYVEILRCRHNMSGIGGLRDLEMADMSEAEKAQEYRSKDYFKIAEADNACELITDGHARRDFLDTFAPTGSYFYLVRPCVAPGRLADKDQLTARNCSRRVGISSELSDFTNKRKAKEMEAMKLAAAYGSKMDATTNAMQQLASTANDVINECDERNRQRLITKKVREAWVTIFAAVAEVGVELATIPGTGPAEWLKHYTFRRKDSGTFESFMDLTQLIGALQGYMLADTFKKLTASSHDMIRTCATYKRLIDEYGILEKNLANFTFKYGYYFAIADLAQKGQLIADGEEIQLPKVDNMRGFQDQPVPEVAAAAEAQQAGTDQGSGGDAGQGQ